MKYSEFTFFWEHKAGAVHPECSQFYKSPFMIDGIEFNCAEQWMHWKKAILFGDQEVAQQILKAKSPFDQKKWDVKFLILMLRYGQQLHMILYFMEI